MGNGKCRRGRGAPGTLQAAGGSAERHGRADTVWRFLTVRPRNPTPQESKTCVHMETCAQMFTVAVSTTTRAWTPAERPSTGAGINP